VKTHALFMPVPSKSDLAKTKLLEAALEVFGQKGLAGATVREIARAAGQNVAAIAYYFGGKEHLYCAVVEGIVREIRHTLRDVLGEIATMRRQDQVSPQAAVGLLTQFLCSVYARLLSRTDIVALGRILVREQMQPTAAFEILYNQGFRELHEALCFLVGAALGQDPGHAETILRTHTIMGQVYFFAMSRQTILRRLGWRSLAGEKAARVTRILEQNIRVLLSGLAEETKGVRLARAAGAEGMAR
jgi:TetR/AcrR family transcriptional regulator, regulator of cefoperazone and chloramphenicol sensitivity